MCQECQRPALGSVYCAEHVPVVSAPPPPPRPFTAFHALLEPRLRTFRPAMRARTRRWR